MDSWTTEQKLMLGGVILAVLFFMNSKPQDEHPDPEDDARTANFNSAFEGSHRSDSEVREDAQRLSDIVLGAAEALEMDGKSLNEIKTGGQLNHMRSNLRFYAEKGGSFVDTYPHLGPAIDEFMTARVGVDDNEVTTESRRTWVRAFRDLSKSLDKTARSF